MSWLLLAGLAVVTLASRVLPMALLPTPRGRAAHILEALPAPLFASLAALSVVGGGEPPTVPVLLAGTLALAGALRRSLPLTLVCGIAGFLLGQLLV